MFGIGMPELILIAVVALIVLGPQKLPDLAKAMGKAMREFKKATSELKETLQIDEEVSEVKKAFSEFQSDVNQAVSPEAGKKPSDAPETAPPADAGPAAPAGEEAGGDNLDELKKAFDTWNTGAEGAGDKPPQPVTPQADSDKTKSG